MLELIQIHSDHIVTAIFVAIALAMMLTRPKVSCCQQRRWERWSRPAQHVGKHTRTHDPAVRRSD